MVQEASLSMAQLCGAVCQLNCNSVTFYWTFLDSDYRAEIGSSVSNSMCKH